MQESDNLDEQLAVSSDQPKKKLPNTAGILVCGILSIPFAGLLGLILGIISLSMANSALRDYKIKPEQYTESSYKNVNAGKICAIIGLILSPLWLLIVFSGGIAGF